MTQVKASEKTAPAPTKCTTTVRIAAAAIFLSKVIEKIVLWQLFTYLNSHDLLCPSQSTYSPRHSTETALFKMTIMTFCWLWMVVMCVLIVLSLSSDFDTIDHHILFHRLQSLYGISGTVLPWFEFYLTAGTQTVTVTGQSSRRADVWCPTGLSSWSFPLHSLFCASLFFD